MTRLNLIIGLLFLTIQSFGQSRILINDASEKKIIDYRIVGTWDSYDKQEYLDADGQYFGKCMTIKLHSRIDSAVFIFIDNGIMLMCDDTATQDMIITKPIYVHLKARQYKTVQLYAMCSEIHDGMPHKHIAYKVGSIADNNLVSIAKTIDEMFMNNIAGQGAVWAYTDKADEADLRKYGATTNSLQLTIDILNKAGVETKLNPPKVDSTATQTYLQTIDDYQDDNYFSIKKYVVYCATGVVLFLLGTTIVLIFRKRKSNNDEPTI
jgi:hypothetical protein